ncbi:MAG: hypothetical protein HRU06_11070 [Oceanospirillaceae bacterium]|nr:hypothetical protein [Oceanospirillaceae bacterium]
MHNKTRSEQNAQEQQSIERNAIMITNDINHILVHGAQISFSKLRRAGSHDARIFYFAEIGVYLEVSLSSGSGITDDSRRRLAKIHQKALNTLMDANRAERKKA